MATDDNVRIPKTLFYGLLVSCVVALGSGAFTAGVVINTVSNMGTSGEKFQTAILARVKENEQLAASNLKESNTAMGEVKGELTRMNAQLGLVLTIFGNLTSEAGKSPTKGGIVR